MTAIVTNSGSMARHTARPKPGNVILRQLSFCVVFLACLFPSCDEGNEAQTKACRITGMTITSPWGLRYCSWKYDNQGRVTEEIYGREGTDSKETFRLSYSANDVLLTDADRRVWKRYSLDADGRIVKIITRSDNMGEQDWTMNFAHKLNETTVTVDNPNYPTAYRAVYTWDEKLENVVKAVTYEEDLPFTETVFEYDETLNPLQKIMFNSSTTFFNGTREFMFARLWSKNNITRTEQMYLNTERPQFRNECRYTYQKENLPERILEIYVESSYVIRMSRESDYTMEYECL